MDAGVRELIREPEALFWVFAFPLVLAAVLGFAFREGGVPASRIAVLPGAGAEELVATLARAPHLEVALHVAPTPVSNLAAAHVAATSSICVPDNPVFRFHRTVWSPPRA